jgi:hypothetical protein
MSLIVKQLLINNFKLPKEVIDIVKDYTFHKIKKIPENDERFHILLTIPFKEYDRTDDSTYVYLTISEEKDYLLVYKNFQIQLLTLRYGADDDVVHFVNSSIFAIE